MELNRVAYQPDCYSVLQWQLLASQISTLPHVSGQTPLSAVIC